MPVPEPPVPADPVRAARGTASGQTGPVPAEPGRAEPVQDAAAQALTVQAQPASPAGLVVSEHPVLGSLVSEILRDMGLTPRLTTPTGFDREAASKAAVCVVVAPRADAGLAGLLRSLNGTPVIYLDGSFGRESEAIRDYPGVRAVIGYPFRVEALKQAIAEQLRPIP